MLAQSVFKRNIENKLEFTVMTHTSGKQIDHYEISRLLGYGGMNRVYLGYDLTNQQEVVLKFPNAVLIGDIVVFERHKREAEIGRQVHHPNIQQMLYTDERRSDNYLVIEYIKGRTLRSVLDDYMPHPMPLTEALNITPQICDALVYCHEKGIFHRDIKPENIMVQDDGTIKIIDFGIALLRGARRVTWHGFSGTVGTPDYMSPEQLKGKRGKASSDIYAGGGLLYEMLCGHTPFEGDIVLAIINQHISQDPPSILTKNPARPAELATVVMHTIRRDQDKRYATMKELLHDLRNLEEVNVVPYEPDAPKLNQTGRIIFTIMLIITAAFLVSVALGILLQLIHNGIR